MHAPWIKIFFHLILKYIISPAIICGSLLLLHTRKQMIETMYQVASARRRPRRALLRTRRPLLTQDDQQLAARTPNHLHDLQTSIDTI